MGNIEVATVDMTEGDRIIDKVTRDLKYIEYCLVECPPVKGHPKTNSKRGRGIKGIVNHLLLRGLQ